MSALSQYTDIVNNTLLPLANQYNDARVALLAKYQSIDPAATDAQSQFDALAGDLAAIATLRASNTAAVAEANSVFLAAFAEDGAAANALSKSVTTLASATDLPAGKVAVQLAITAAVADAAKATEAAKNSAAPPSADPTKATNAVADGEKAGDINTNPTDQRLASSAQATPTTAGTTNAGSTTAGKAGSSPTAAAASIVGQRKFNPLGDFSSYTYSIGLYLMDSDEFNQYMNGDHTVISKFKLVAQSGGGSAESRASGLDLDVYIDDLEFTTKTAAAETQSATNSVKFKFKIYEPFGFSFPHKLVQAQIARKKASNTISGSTGQEAIINVLTEKFLLTVKFYGYDKDGKIVTSKDYPQADVATSDPQCVFERAFPVQISTFTFRLENKMTVYSVVAEQVSNQIAMGTKLGSLTKNITLSGETVNDVLSGPNQNSAKKSIQGLAQILNDMESDFVKSNKFKYANKYIIKFAPGCIIGDARMVPADYYVKSTTPFNSLQHPNGSNERTSWADKLGSIDKSVKTIALNSGTPIVQAIDNIINQSQYLKNMMTAIDKEKNTDSSEDVNPNPTQLAWFNISTSVTILPGGKDPTRNDYVYEITYTIQDYQIPYIRALYASKTSEYYGPHKTYNYWYTGKNTEILSYEQDYQFLYHLDAVSSSQAELNNNQSATVANKAGQNVDSTTTTVSGTNDIINSIKSFLYSPGDLVKFKCKILGDPDYIMTAIGSGGTDGLKKWYGSNFTINPNTGQVFIEIYFQQAEDYNINTGLLAPNGDIQFMTYPADMKNKPHGMTYQVHAVISTFSKGKFEQSIQGTIPEFVRSKVNKVTPPSSVSPNDRTNNSTPASTEVNPTDSRLATGTQTAPISTALISTEVNPTDSRLATGTQTAPISSSGPDTSPTGGPPPNVPAAPSQPPPYVPPNATTNSTTTFAGATLVATDNFGRVFVSATLPSGTSLDNIAGWGPTQWDGLINNPNTKPEDIAVLSSLKASYDTVVKPLSAETTAKVAVNDKAHTDYDTMVANWGTNASGTVSTPTNNAVADDDRTNPK